MRKATRSIEQEWKLERDHTITIEQDVIPFTLLPGDETKNEEVATIEDDYAMAGSSSGRKCLANLDLMMIPWESKNSGQTRDVVEYEPRVKNPRVITHMTSEAVPFQMDSFSSWQSEQSGDGGETAPRDFEEPLAGKKDGRGPIFWPSTKYTSTSCDWDELSLVTSNKQHNPFVGANCPCDQCIWWRPNNPSNTHKGKGRGKRSYYSTL